MLLILSVLAVWLTSAADTRTTRGRLSRSQQVVSHPIVPTDTILPVVSADSLVIHGFDKPMRSHYESFFATNLTGSPITGITIDFVYHDMKGAMLHARRVTVGCSIPPRETRQIKIHTWDVQEMYYYRLTRVRSRSERAVEFDVTIFLREIRH